MAPRPNSPTRDLLRRTLLSGTFLWTRGALEGAAAVARCLPQARPHVHGVHVDRDIPYLRDRRREHRLDLYVPRDAGERCPLVLYIHGGGFRMLSKSSHFIMSLALARHGFAVASVNYRLSPAYPFPAALVDCVRALCWLSDRAAPLGFDPNRIVLAGSSAGANLAAALTLLCCYRRPEPWTEPLWSRGVRPRALLSYYGLLQTTNPGRLRRYDSTISWLLQAHIDQLCADYLATDHRVPAATRELADPLVMLECSTPPERPLPDCFAAVGTRDPVLADTKRLEHAYKQRGVRCVSRYYDGQIHGFDALVWTRAAQQCWQDTYDFLDETLAG